MKVGLHQRSVLSRCLFAMVMDMMPDEIREEATWAMMFADDNKYCTSGAEHNLAHHGVFHHQVVG